MCQNKFVCAVWNKCDVFHYLVIVHFFPIEDKKEKRLFFVFLFQTSDSRQSQISQ